MSAEPGCGADACGLRAEHRLAGYWFAAVGKERWPEDPETREWIEANWDDEVGDCRQEIVFIGAEMNQQKIEERLDAALLTDDEMRSGPESWRDFDDPLSSWEPQVEDDVIADAAASA